ncbi:MAG: hypothetical protein BGP09_28025 [Rhizobium sp. 60-20]|nr:MAG: hypothetical protein BGP09_28025 [Rhizobium sp. 60-20]
MRTSGQSVPNPSVLINSIPVLYLSRDIIGNKRADYKRLLAATMKDAWEEWILYMREAVRDTTEWWTARVRAIRDLLDQTAQQRHDHAEWDGHDSA